jgi:hypothetical protein
MPLSQFLRTVPVFGTVPWCGRMFFEPAPGNNPVTSQLFKVLIGW